MVRQTTQIKGDIPSIVRNDKGLYLGNLAYYFRVVWNHAKNLNHPYHNFRHMTHVLYLCHDACMYYAEAISPRAMRNLLIAALFHDFDHTGKSGDDSVNINRAIEGLRIYILKEDLLYFDSIADTIRCTEFPYKIPLEEVSFLGLIIRDADLSQSFSVAWIQQVVLGLAEEWGKHRTEVLKMQVGFHSKVLHYETNWAKEKFPQADIETKVSEAVELIEILEGDAVPAV